MTNAATIDALTADIDINGRAIEIGSLVRSFGCPLLLRDDRILGLNSVPTPADGDRLNYIDGIVEAIGDVEFEGCKRYTIRAIRKVCTYEYGKPAVVQIVQDFDCKINPPLNGTRSTMGARTFGVVVL